ncbi:hypothetical protein Dsin_011266 [Dipteronia sinensis]|uniref:Methyltransferase PMT27 n=1 Tax=Dipteronia sinensis TaxID=43782 RepID=A0AAE0EDF8_9ROSI|nr:hypothetical protein Dsin_011266 [Dipteronia sinensis]
MAIGNKRGSKRSSSSTSSYTSTITTIIFIALCVIGVWMLTNNSIAPPQTTTTAATTDTIITNTNTDTKLSTNTDKKDQTTTTSTTVFEDNPGYLPNDAIQSDDPKQNDNAAEAAAAVGGSGGGGGDNKNEEAKVVGLQGQGNDKESVEGQIQISEESTLTQNQQQETDHDQNQQQQQQQQVDSQNQEQQQQLEEEEKVQVADHDQSQQQQQQQKQQQEEEEKVQVAENTNKASESEKITNEELMIKQQQQEDQISDQDNKKQSMQQNDDDDQKQLQEQQEEKQNPQNPDETNTNSEEQTVQTATETIETQQQSSSSSSETESSPDEETRQKTITKKTKRKRTKEHKPTTTTTTGPEEPVLATTGTKPGIPKESTESKKTWSTQAKQSASEKERREDESKGKESIYGYTWHLCNESSGPDFIPCLDNEKALKKLHSTRHYEHRERHCPEEGPTCLVPLPEGYKKPIKWPHSRDKIWYRNVPHKTLADVKGHQNWVKVTGEFLTFPGGGTQFIHGALHYIDVIQEAIPDIAWGKNTRVVLDVGCGVASFGGYLFERDVLTMSFAPKDEHEAQVQFALERGIPAISAVMGTQRLPFPSKVFDLLHCARCRVPWHIEGGMLLLELNRVLRPGGYFVWSATPVYQKLEEDVEIWKAMSALTVSMCWELVTTRMDKINSVGFAVYRKPITNECYEKRKENNPPLCKTDDDPNAAWYEYVPLQACLHRLAVNSDERGTSWPEQWPLRLQTPPYWTRVVSNTYMSGLGISWSDVRSVMDMRAVYGGFAAALKDIQVWVMNVVNIDSPDTLPMIYERGLFGIYHDWCESFSTYPRTYDLLHADHLFSKLKKKCKLAPVMAEVDRIVRPGGKLIVRDESSAIGEVENLLKSLRWEVHLTFSKDQEGILSAQKGDWRPDTFQASS